jgi:hypothetical protein
MLRMITYCLGHVRRAARDQSPLDKGLLEYCHEDIKQGAGQWLGEGVLISLAIDKVKEGQRIAGKSNLPINR